MIASLFIKLYYFSSDHSGPCFTTFLKGVPEMLNKKFSKGFSLIELLIVVAIVGILAAVAVPAYFNHILRTRQADAYHNLLDIKAAQEMHYSMFNEYAGLISSGTFSDLLSFDIADTQYYRYKISSLTGSTFTAEATGKYGKLAGNQIIIKDNEDPCIVPDSGNLKQSLGLEECPP
jgi:type IV pilus assembly protein PilE